MVKNVVGYKGDALWSLESFLPVDIPDLLIINVRIGVHSFNVVYTEREYVLIIDGIDDGIGMQLVAKSLLGGEVLGIGSGPCVCGEDRCASKAEHIVFLKTLHNGVVHITKLAAMTLIEDNNNLAAVDLMILVFLDEGGQLLDGRNDDMCFGVAKLLLQNLCRSITVRRALFKAVVFLHGLVIQILTVNDKEHL